MNLDITHESYDNKHVLKVSGEVDAYTAPQLSEQLLALTEKGGNTVVVDLSKTEYMDSTGIGIIIAGLKSAKKHGSSMSLANLTPRVKRLFDITGLSEVMDIHEQEEGENVGKQS